MRPALRALTAIWCAILMMGATASPCAGWESTPQQRHDCCERSHCRHLGEFGHSGASQSDADQCCAMSERGTSNRTDEIRVTPALETTPAVASEAVEVPLAEFRRLVFRDWPPGHHPTLLLKSVLQI